MRLDSLDYICCPKCLGKFLPTIEERTQEQIIRGALECLTCGRRFEIMDGLANLIFPENLEEEVLSVQRWYDQRPKYDGRLGAFRLGKWEWVFRKNWASRHWARRLEVGEGASVLETGVGNGRNLPYIANVIGRRGRLDGLDISSQTLKVARARMKSRCIRTELVHGNASFLPYKSGKFDAVLHVGGFNEFGDKKRAVEEMLRVARAGAKIILCDEGLAPGREKTLLGKYILKCSKLYANKPPVELLQQCAEDLRLYWICQRTLWVIECRKARRSSV